MSRLDRVSFCIAVVFSVHGICAGGKDTSARAAGRVWEYAASETLRAVEMNCGDTLLAIKPLESLAVGTFDFCEGTDGFVEILAKDSTGLVVADAVEFTKAHE